MLEVRKIGERDKQLFIDLIKSDAIGHVFAFYDLQYEPEHTTTYAAFENGKFEGYVLIYTRTDKISVVLECNEKAADVLMEHAPQNHFIIHTQLDLLPIIRRKFPDEKHYTENWMLVNKGTVDFFESKCVRRLSGRIDAERLAALLSTREDRPSETAEKYIDYLSRMPTYGVCQKDELVSYASSFIQMPQVWMIGGVYTNPKQRNRGYSTLATSAITKEALKTAETAALFVRSDNYPAIRVYEKVGYRKIGEKAWVDIGTGLKP